MKRRPILLAVALGDAYGAGFEFAAPEVVARWNTGRRYRVGARVPAGRYTDDTQMSVALAESLLTREPWEPRYLAERFVAAYRRDPRVGYSTGFGKLLASCQNGSELLARIDPHSERNGAAMRSVPLGVVPDLNDALHRACVQAAITHDTPGGIASSQAVAALAHHGLHGGELSGAAAFLERTLPGFGWREPWRGPVPVHGIATVRAALTALGASRSVRELLQNCVAYTGDTDSVAAIALGVAACYPEFPLAWPGALLRDLENGPYGRDWLIALDQRLAVTADRTPT